MYRLASKGLMTPPCGVPQVLPFPPLTRGLPFSSRSSTGTFNHILIRRSMSRSTILRGLRLRVVPSRRQTKDQVYECRYANQSECDRASLQSDVHDACLVLTCCTR